jgi:hypothetical protein
LWPFHGDDSIFLVSQLFMNCSANIYSIVHVHSVISKFYTLLRYFSVGCNLLLWRDCDIQMLEMSASLSWYNLDLPPDVVQTKFQWKCPWEIWWYRYIEQWHGHSTAIWFSPILTRPPCVFTALVRHCSIVINGHSFVMWTCPPTWPVYMYIFNVSITNVQNFENVRLEVWVDYTKQVPYIRNMLER